MRSRSTAAWPRRILHPTDFSGGARRAETEAVRLARASDATLLLLHVVPEAHEGLVRSGSAAAQIMAVVRRARCDLIVMGTRGRSPLARSLLGSVADRVVRAAPCPVLTVRS
ncbi:MAG TPA: universal stress protein [Methylomirabilota bacterium]|nr:universal stress protein [Methylomirabilota bacterium]